MAGPQVVVDGALQHGKERLPPGGAVLGCLEAVAAAPQPRERSAARPHGVLPRHPGRRALVEGHDHVCPQRTLDVDHPLGRKVVAAPVDVAAEGHPVVADVADGGEREDLESPGIGEDRTLPAHEVVQPAQLRHHVGAGPQVEVVGVGENHRRARRRQLLRRDALHRPLGADRHERRRLHGPVGENQSPGPGPALSRARNECRGVHGAPRGNCRLARGVGRLRGQTAIARRPSHGTTAIASP